MIAQDASFRGARQAEVSTVDDCFAKSEVGGEDIARDGGKEQVEEDRPARPDWNTRPRLDDRPPKHESGGEKRKLFHDMQG